MLRSFLYCLIYCIKEVINGKLFCILNLRLLSYEAATAWNRRIPCNFFQNTDPIVFVLFISLFFAYCIEEGIKGKIFWRLNKNGMAYEAATAWNRGIPSKILTFLIKLYLVLLNGSIRLSEVSRTKYNLIRNLKILQEITLFQAVAAS